MSKAVPDSVTRLIEAFTRLPSVGPKTASRLAYYLLRAPDELSTTLAQAIGELKANTKLCSICYNITEVDPCPICEDTERDGSLIAVVEEPLDVLALERTGAFTGRYHVLHGALNPIEGIGPEDLRMRELFERVRAGGVNEIILATNPSMEGDYTAAYLQQQLQSSGVRMTRLARGLPVGGDLEYADQNTLLRALFGRQEI